VCKAYYRGIRTTAVEGTGTREGDKENAANTRRLIRKGKEGEEFGHSKSLKTKPNMNWEK